jgi:hypothetical protein
MSILNPFVWLFNEIVDLFNSLKREWNKLKPTMQQALINGSGIVNEIAKDFSLVPESILANIQKLYPNLNVTDIQKALQLAGKDLGIAENLLNGSLIDAITAFQAYFKAKNDISPKALWAGLSEAATLIATYLETGLSWQLATSFVEFVYQHFIKEA